MYSFGKKLKECREQKKISQNELAKLIDGHHSAIGKYERDEVKPSVDVAVKLANVLDTTVGYLLGENDDKNVLQDPAMLNRLNDINKLPLGDKEAILKIIDAYIRDAKSKQVYG